MSLNSFTIIGERCSGTHFLQYAITTNFKLTYTRLDKHFFGFSKLHNEITLCIIRDPVEWIDSFFKKPFHVPKENKNIDNFLNNEWRSIHDNTPDTEIMEDRHIITKERYKNIFELRKTKIEYFLNLSGNVMIIKYEDLRDDYKNTLDAICSRFNLVKKNKEYINITKYKGTYNAHYSRQKVTLSLDTIKFITENVCTPQENKLGYLIKYTASEKLKIITDITDKLKNFNSGRGAVNLFNDQYSFVSKLKNIIRMYLSEDIEYSGFLDFDEIGKKIEYSFPVYKNDQPLFVIRIK